MRSNDLSFADLFMNGICDKPSLFSSLSLTLYLSLWALSTRLNANAFAEDIRTRLLVKISKPKPMLLTSVVGCVCFFLLGKFHDIGSWISRQFSKWNCIILKFTLSSSPRPALHFSRRSDCETKRNHEQGRSIRIAPTVNNYVYIITSNHVWWVYQFPTLHFFGSCHGPKEMDTFFFSPYFHLSKWSSLRLLCFFVCVLLSEIIVIYFGTLPRKNLEAIESNRLDRTK